MYMRVILVILLTATLLSGCNRGDSEAEINRKARVRQIGRDLATVERDLKFLAAAVEAYHFDFNTYPVDIFQLTSPVAYILRIDKDPFSQGKVYGYGRDEEKGWKIWSVGPDGIDQSGSLIYDKNKGFDTEGDILAPYINLYQDSSPDKDKK